MKSTKLIIAAILAMAAHAAFAKVYVDVLVAYDTTAQSWLSEAGTTPEAFAEMQIAKSNEVLENSNLTDTFEWRLAGVYKGDATYAGTGGALTGTLDDLTESENTAWAAYRTARDNAKADIMVLLVDTGVEYGQVGLSNTMIPMISTDGGKTWERYWGIESNEAKGWLSAYATRSFAVCNIGSAEKEYVVTHEMGHIMGAGHSETISPSFDEPGPQLYDYSRAYMYQGSDENYYATIMGYNKTGYDGDLNFYTIIPCFSSPALTNPFTGEPLGDKDHDNVQTLKNTAAAVSQFRNASVKPDPVVAPVAGAFKKKVIVNGAVKKGSDLVGLLQITVAATTKKGISTVSAVFTGMDGKKKKIKVGKLPVTAIGDTSYVEIEDAVAMGMSEKLNATVGSDGSIGGFFGGYTVAPVELGVKNGSTLEFYLEDEIGKIQGMDVISAVELNGVVYDTLPYKGAGELMSVVNNKWVMNAKAGKLKMKKNKETKAMELVVDFGKQGLNTNLSAAKLTYTAKTGLFKGTFTAYVYNGKKLVAYKFNVQGMVADGEGYGTATNKKAGLTLKVKVAPVK